MPSPTLDAYLAADPTRCAHGYAPNQHPGLCGCGDAEWHIFTRALKLAADDAALVSQTRMRPLLRGIEPKHIGQLYRRARKDGLIEVAGWEPSTDVAGGNADKQQRLYRLRT